MSADGLGVAAVIVTCNSERFLPDLIASVAGQTRSPDALIAIDDYSTDSTVAMLTDAGWSVERSTSSATDAKTRIAQNFTQGVRLAARFDFAILGDHDDYWLPDRIDHQLQRFAQHPESWFIASNGRIMNSTDTLRDAFPVPEDWEDFSRAAQFRYAVRHSLATGGASAVRPRNILDPQTKATPIPDGWLHDRWWSLAAWAKGGLRIDPQPVIEYRVQANQQIGLEAGRQGKRIPSLRSGDLGKARQVAQLLGKSRR